MLALYLWDLTQGVRNRFLQVFAGACLMGGAALLAAAPEPETLPMLLVLALLFFGSLIAMLLGWVSGQQAREQAGFLFAQPITPGQMIVAKLLGTGSWCLVLLLLFMGPAAVQAGLPGTMLALTALGAGLIFVCVLAGLILGLIAGPVSGLLAVLLIWAVLVAGWDIGLWLLSQMAWMQQLPGVFIALMLANPASTFRVTALVGLDAIPFAYDAAELEAGRWIFEHIWFVAACIFALWLAVLLPLGTYLLRRQEF